MITRERIEAQIAKLETERTALIEQAQQQIAALNGALAALRQLLEDAAPDVDEAARRDNGAAVETVGR